MICNFSLPLGFHLVPPFQVAGYQVSSSVPNVLTLSKKIPTKNGSWWLTELKFKNSLAALFKRGPLRQARLPEKSALKLPAGRTELPAPHYASDG